MLYSLSTTLHVGPQVYKTGSNSLTKIFIASLKKLWYHLSLFFKPKS